MTQMSRLPSSGNFMAKKCSHEDTRLSCTECSIPICSNCFVQCPVGFRCQSCAGVKQQASQSRKGAARTFFAAALIGCVAGWLMPFINIPWVSCFICFFIGIYGGRWLYRFVDYSLGSKTALTIVFGTLMGMAFSPLGLVPLLILNFLELPFSGTGFTVIDALGQILCVLFNPVCFFAGLLRATIWGEY